jgi:DNA-binding NtrC family response regulator
MISEKLRESAQIAVICGLSMDEWVAECRKTICEVAVAMRQGNKSEAARDLRTGRNRVARFVR